MRLAAEVRSLRAQLAALREHVGFAGYVAPDEREGELCDMAIRLSARIWEVDAGLILPRNRFGRIGLARIMAIRLAEGLLIEANFAGHIYASLAGQFGRGRPNIIWSQVRHDELIEVDEEYCTALARAFGILGRTLPLYPRARTPRVDEGTRLSLPKFLPGTP
jgi:hypothetical protein